MMAQYQTIKKQHSDKFVLFRLGDFYELFFDDAIEGAKLMEIVLTHRGEVPMCGVPHHQLKNYTAKLLQSGKKIAIVEQSGEQETGTLIKREVREILTPASLIDESLLQEKENNFLLAVQLKKIDGNLFFLCCQCDLSTGETFLDIFPHDEITLQNSIEEILAMSKAKEILLVGTETTKMLNELFEKFYPKLLVNKASDETSSLHLAAIKKLCQENMERYVEMGFQQTLTATFEYLQQNRGVDTQTIFSTLLPPVFRPLKGKMILDERTKRNLELFQSNSQDEELTLIKIIDKTFTPMGARRLRQEMSLPMLDYDEARERLERVRWWTENLEHLNHARKLLNGIKDISRMATRIALQQPSCEEIMLFQTYLQKANIFAKSIVKMKNCPQKKIFYDTKYLSHLLATTDDLCQKINDAIIYDDENDEELFKNNTKKSKAKWNLANHQELQENRQNHRVLLQKMSSLLAEEQTKINLKIRLRYNDALGYFFEINKIQAQQLPAYFIRKQTLTNCERFTTEKLTSLEGEIVTLNEQSKQIEKEILSSLVISIQKSLGAIKQLSAAIAFLDLEVCFAFIAVEKNYCQPTLSKGRRLEVKNMRHPVVETMLHNKGETIIKTNICIGDQQCVHIITGPNMSGKSTFLRQTAVVVLMAHLGCFVPAQAAIVPETDRIFTRVGATDHLAKGESTFLVEMKESAYILRHASEMSLVILDEIGRGTSTFDGLSLAYSIVDYLTVHLPKMKTLFATHYHELTQMSALKPSFIGNYHVSVKENQGNIVFLKKVIPGVAEKSYGIHVAKLAGMPKEITEKAEKILEILEKTRKPLRLKNTQNAFDKNNDQQKIDHEKQHLEEKKRKLASDILGKLEKLDIHEMTPVQALCVLEEWKKTICLNDENR